MQGTLDLLILQTLALRPEHGHAIAQSIERRLDDVLQVGHGSLYPALQRLLKQRRIAAEETPDHFPRNGFRTELLNYMDITSATGEMSSSLHVLLAAVGVLLLIACVNVANLQLAEHHKGS